MPDRARIILWAAAAAVAALTALGLGDRMGLEGPGGWALDLVSHWPKHLFLLGLVAGALAAWRRMFAQAGLALAAAALNAALVLGVGGFALPQAAPDGSRLLRVANANVHRSLAALERLAAEAEAYGADIVSIHEVPDDLTLADVERMFPGLPHREMPGVGRNGLKLIRRSLLVARDADHIRVETFPSSHGVIIRAQAGGVQLASLHPPSPGDPGLKADRDVQIRRAGEGLDLSQPFILMGDFNSTPWGRAYGLAPGERAGDPRFEGTFPSFAGWFGLPIDHIRFGGGPVLTDYRVGPDIGSDHLPLFATFALP